MEPSEDAIRECAYRLYLQSGCTPGRDLENWFEARRRLEAGFNGHARHRRQQPVTSPGATRTPAAG